MSNLLNGKYSVTLRNGVKVEVEVEQVKLNSGIQTRISRRGVSVYGKADNSISSMSITKKKFIDAVS